MENDPRVRFDTESARLLSAGRAATDATWSLPSHTHTSWEFVYFVEGTGVIDIPDARIRPQAYHLVVYPPGLPHAEASSRVEPEHTIFFLVDVPGQWLAGNHILVPDSTGEIGWLCERIIAEFSRYGATPLANAFTRAFLYLVERARKGAVAVPHDVVDHALQYMHTNYQCGIDLPSLANIVSASESTLAHRFTAKLGISPLRYLQRIRIEAARRLLSTTAVSVGEIASQVGFGDPLYFSRAFSRVVGCSPTEYRRRSDTADPSIPSAEDSIF